MSSAASIWYLEVQGITGVRASRWSKMGLENWLDISQDKAASSSTAGYKNAELSDPTGIFQYLVRFLKSD